MDKDMRYIAKIKNHLLFALISIMILSVVVISPWHKPSVARASWYPDAAWQYRQQIVIDHTKVAADQSDFPVMLKITSQYNPVFASAKDDGTDILFTSSDGATKLSHEIETFSKTSKELWAWVKIPTLSSSNDVTLYMYYGNADATNQQNNNDVWSNNYSAVWHLGEASGNSLDSTSSGISGTIGTGVTQNVSNKLARYYSLAGAGSVNYGNSSALPNGTSAKTLCGWGRSNSVAVGYRWMAAYGTGATNQALFIGMNGTTAYGGGYGNDLTSSNFWSAGEWKYLCVTYDGTQGALYGNGSQLVAPTTKPWSLVRNQTYLGQQVGATEYWNGDLDQVTISSTARSSTWIQTEYNNQNDPGSFATFYWEKNQNNYNQTTESDWLSSNWLYRQKIQVTNNTASALTDYQVLIDSGSLNLSNVFSKANSDGSDIRFGNNSSSEELNYYMQSYSKVSGTAKIWVKIPYLPASGSGYIYLYYGNSGAASLSNLTNVNSSTETKISIGLTANATSYFSSYVPANTIDGNTSSTFWHGNNDGQLHNLWVSGISNKILSSVKVYHYAGQWASTFKIQGSNDNFASDIREFASVTSPTQNMTFSNINDSASSVRYQTLTTTNWYNPTIYEIEIYTKFKTASSEPTLILSGSEVAFDSDIPSNPSSFVGKNISGGAITLDPTAYYNYTTPEISWPTVGSAGGASDSTTGVDGYYMYFGTSCGGGGADPALTRGLLSDTGSGLHYSAAVSISAPTLSTDGTYCLRLKTKDVAGNISSAVEAFVYKFDASSPSQPTYIAANPAGYTSTNSFSFSWPAASDTGGSLFAGYQYKRGGSSGDGWSSTITQTSVSGIQSYQTGENIFLVRAIDNAQNVSSETQTNYYYSSNAPTKPTSFSASPEISATNNFSFSWTAPVHDIEIDEYGYSINAAPTMQNITWTGSNSTSIAAGPFATKQGVNTIYLVAKDAAGNYAFDQANYATANFDCQTSAPPTPVAVSAVDSSDRSISRWMITTQWATGTGQDSATFHHYSVERSTDNATFTELATTTSTAYIDADLSNTSAYYYRIKSVDNAGSSSVASTTVSKTPTGNYPTPPTIVSEPTSVVKATSATVTWVTNRASTGAVKFGTSESDMDRSQLDAEERTEHQITLPGLEPNTTYYFKVQSLDSARDYSDSEAYSSIFTLKTLASPGIQNVKITNISLDSADISWETSSASTTLIRYGTTINYDKSWEDASSYTTNHTFKLQDLNHTSTYHFKISGLDADENSINSDDYVFDTLPLPKISAVSFDTDYSDAEPQTSISWTTNVATTSSVEYFPKSGGNVAYEESQSDLITTHKVKLTKLSDNTSYSFYVSGTDQFGNKATSDEYIFNTPFDSRPARITDVQVETSNVGLDKQDKAQIIVSWKTDEPATTQVEYGKGVSGDYTNKTSEDKTLTNEHFVILSDLEPNQPYHLRVISKDKGGNESIGEDTNSIPGEVPRSMLQVIFSTFEKVFGWLEKLV